MVLLWATAVNFITQITIFVKKCSPHAIGAGNYAGLD